MPDVFELLCNQRLDELGAAGGGDLIEEFFEPVSVMSLAHAIGIAEQVDPPTLVRWFAGLAAGVSNYEDSAAKTALCDEATAEIDTIIRPLFEDKFSHPDGGMLSGLIHSAEGSFDERVAWAMPSLKLVLLGGLQEPAHGGATIAHCLLSHPNQLRSLQADVSLVNSAVEEGLRWTAPIGNLLRGVVPGATIGDVDLPDGARVILIVSSANRDRHIWGETADEFDIDRPRRTHLSFATGPHYCIGHHFARAQLRIAIQMLFERFPRMQLDPERAVTYRGHEYRSPTSLHVFTN
jgi:cytochrome P450